MIYTSSLYYLLFCSINLKLLLFKLSLFSEIGLAGFLDTFSHQQINKRLCTGKKSISKFKIGKENSLEHKF